jgi:hypothetical protein
VEEARLLVFNASAWSGRHSYGIPIVLEGEGLGLQNLCLHKIRISKSLMDKWTKQCMATRVDVQKGFILYQHEKVLQKRRAIVIPLCT